MMVKGAKSISGVKGNLRFIVSYKFWATLTVFAFGLAIGFALCAGPALAHSGGLAKDGCHKDRTAGERHTHIPGTRERDMVCVTADGVKFRLPAQCGDLLAWLVDGNRDSKIIVSKFALDELAAECLGRQPRKVQSPQPKPRKGNRI